MNVNITLLQATKPVAGTIVFRVETYLSKF